jgi:hypothetical protein
MTSTFSFSNTNPTADDNISRDETSSPSPFNPLFPISKENEEKLRNYLDAGGIEDFDLYNDDDIGDVSTKMIRETFDELSLNSGWLFVSHSL